MAADFKGWFGVIYDVFQQAESKNDNTHAVWVSYIISIWQLISKMAAMGYARMRSFALRMTAGSQKRSFGGKNFKC